jgi:hypothetical protein
VRSPHVISSYVLFTRRMIRRYLKRFDCTAKFRLRQRSKLRSEEERVFLAA